MSGSFADGAIECALEALSRLGLEGEAYVEDGARVKVAVSSGTIESIEERFERGAGVRVFLEGRVGFAYSTVLEPQALRETVRLARDIARHAGRDDAWTLPAPGPVSPLPFPNEDAGLAQFGVPERVEIATRVELAALAADPRIQRSRQAVAMDVRGEVRVANTGGVGTGYRYSRALAWIDVVAAEGGASHIGHHAGFALGPAGLDPEAIGRTAAGKAIAKLGSRPARTGKARAVLDREVVWGILDAMGPAFSARRVLKGTSVLAGRLGTRVASDAVHVVDDPRLPGGFGSAPADGEGLATGRTCLVEEGGLAGLLHDTFSTARMKSGRPGSSIRASYSSPPRIGAANLLLLPGDSPAEELVLRARDGWYIREVMGLHTADPISGDFSLGGSGCRIEAGKLGAPVDRLAFSGNLVDLLGAVEAVGSDLTLYPGGGGAPSVLLRELSVAGES